MNVDRYIRQYLFTPLGIEGQKKILASKAAVVGCGALGTNIVNLLLRGGVGYLRVIDRDLVETANLHRQVLYDERDAREGAPKALAAARHAAAINSDVQVEARVADLTPRNAVKLLSGVDLILDGADNVETRYLINDYAVENGLPWIHGGAVGATATCMTFAPGGPCLRCLWPDPPPPGSLPTCDTTGVLPSAPALAAAMQAASAMRLLSGHAPTERMTQIDVWTGEIASVRVLKNPDCPACVRRRFDFLDAVATSFTAVLCGGDSVQITPAGTQSLDLADLAARLQKIARVTNKTVCIEAEVDGATLVIFEDGRVIVKGTSDLARARSLVSRYVGY